MVSPPARLPTPSSLSCTLRSTPHALLLCRPTWLHTQLLPAQLGVDNAGKPRIFTQSALVSAGLLLSCTHSHYYNAMPSPAPHPTLPRTHHLTINPCPLPLCAGRMQSLPTSSAQS